MPININSVAYIIACDTRLNFLYSKRKVKRADNDSCANQKIVVKELYSGSLALILSWAQPLDTLTVFSLECS